MYTKLCNTLGVALCLLGLASPLVFAAEPPVHITIQSTARGGGRGVANVPPH